MYNDYFCWHIRESVYRKSKTVPTIDEYVIHRTGSGGMQMLLVSPAKIARFSCRSSTRMLMVSEKGAPDLEPL
jgi:hypothetical protein